jgi:hypothetical protein
LLLNNFISAISGFRRDVDEICALLGYYARLTDVSGQPIRPILKGQEVQEESIILDSLTLKLPSQTS